MHRNVIETIMGAVVLIVAVVFLVFAYTSSSTGTVSGYPLTATFNNVSGLGPGSDVRLSGIRVGSIVDAELNPEDYTAVVRLTVQNSVKLPTDTSARILSDGLLSDNYLELQPGADDTMLEAGGRIEITQSPINIFDLIARFIHGGGLGGGAGSAGSSPPAETP